MSLLMDVSDYIRRYGTASLSELSQQLRVSPDEIPAAAEVLRQKGRVARRRVLPDCMGSTCSGGGCSCAEAEPAASGKRTPVTVYAWIDKPAAAR